MTRRRTVPDRVSWAVDHLDPAPDARVLEIGCGPGAAAELLGDRLPHGHLGAIDRSATAVRRTVERNAGLVESRRLEVRQAALADLDLAGASVDQVLAVDVNVFWVGDADVELSIISRVLRPGGTVHLVFGAGGPSGTERIRDAVSGALRRSGFSAVALTCGQPAFAVCGTRPDDVAGHLAP